MALCRIVTTPCESWRQWKSSGRAGCPVCWVRQGRVFPSSITPSRTLCQFARARCPRGRACTMEVRTGGSPGETPVHIVNLIVATRRRKPSLALIFGSLCRVIDGDDNVCPGSSGALLMLRWEEVGSRSAVKDERNGHIRDCEEGDKKYDKHGLAHISKGLLFAFLLVVYGFPRCSVPC
jgi:hypothetical protein